MLGAAVRVNNTSSACPNVPWNMPDKRPCAPFTGDRGMLPSAGASERASSKTIDNNASSTQIPPKLKELSPVVRMQAPPCAIARVASEQLTGLVCRNHRIARTRNTCAVLQWMTRRLRGRVGRYDVSFIILRPWSRSRLCTHNRRATCGYARAHSHLHARFIRPQKLNQTGTKQKFEFHKRLLLA